MEFRDIVKERYATRGFTGEIIPEDKIDELLEIIRMAPSSYGLQPWKIKVISDQKTKDKFSPIAYNQIQIKSCSHLLVFCANSNIKGQIERYGELMREKGIADDKIKKATEGMYDFEKSLTKSEKISWAQRQMYIALSNAVNGAKSLGFDSSPMEGFNPEECKNFFDLPKNLYPTALVAVGFASNEAREKGLRGGDKIRYGTGEMFF